MGANKSKLKEVINNTPNYTNINLCQSCEEVSRQFKYQPIVWGGVANHTDYDEWYKKNDCFDKICARCKIK